ncbi:MAG: hypothetical protein U1E36_05305 [Rickettsiales bacterium]
MAFRSRRGRPRLVKKDMDQGTPELQEKRASGSTAEPLDLLLARRLITERQHAAGRRLRWLYTLVFGTPHVTAASFDLFESHRLRMDNTSWRAQKEIEYQKAISILKQHRCLETVQAISIFEERRSWFGAVSQKYGLEKMPPELKRLNAGLTVLAQFFEGK